MKVSTSRDKLPKPIYILIAALFWISLWYIAALSIGNSWLLPYPHTVIKTFAELVIQSNFWLSVFNTMLTVVAGCVIGCVIGCIFAILSSVSRIAATIISPLVTVLRATPVASFIILVYVIVRRMKLPVSTVSLLIVIIMVVPILYSNLLSGIAAFDKDLGEVAKIFRFSFKKKMTLLWIPQATPYILSGVTNALGFAWKAGVAAEVICNLSNTVGQHLYEAKAWIDMDLVFAWTFTVVLLSMLFEIIFKKAFKKGMGKEGKTL